MRINQSIMAFDAYRDLSVSGKTTASKSPDSTAPAVRTDDPTGNASRVAAENVSASASGITDRDTARRLADLARSQILQDPGSALLAQAGGLAESVSKLLQ